MRKASSFALFCTQSSLPGLVVTLSRLLSVGHQEPVVDGGSFSRWGGIFISLVTSFWSSPSWGGAGDAVATLSPLHLQVAEAWGVTVSTPQCFPGCQTVISVSAHSFRKLTTLPLSRQKRVPSTMEAVIAPAGTHRRGFTAAVPLGSPSSWMGRHVKVTNLHLSWSWGLWAWGLGWGSLHCWCVGQRPPRLLCPQLCLWFILMGAFLPWASGRL